MNTTIEYSDRFALMLNVSSTDLSRTASLSLPRRTRVRLGKEREK
ncbi:hypothetical protein [Nostoc sp. DSM 114167]